MTQSNESNPWLGLDIGGANIKAAHTCGWSNSVYFPLWKSPKSLGSAIAKLIELAPPVNGFAVTMTGELADCYSSRAEGVASILEQCTSVLPASMMQVYSVDGKWRTPSSAARAPWMVAASNWHALASYIGMSSNQGLILVTDIGSTTTDIIPILDGKIAMDSTTDSQRLLNGSLVYTGVERSNVSSISRSVPLHEGECPLMNELFATTIDVHLWLGDLDEDLENFSTADGKPATRQCARFRLARVVGEDGTTLTDDDIDSIATRIRADQIRLICDGLSRVVKYVLAPQSTKKKKGGSSRESETTPKSLREIIVVGHGNFLLEDALRFLKWDVPRTEWKTQLGADLARSGPAFAIAKLAQRDFH